MSSLRAQPRATKVRAMIHTALTQKPSIQPRLENLSSRIPLRNARRCWKQPFVCIFELSVFTASLSTAPNVTDLTSGFQCNAWQWWNLKFGRLHGYPSYMYLTMHCSHWWKWPLLRQEVHTTAWDSIIRLLKRNPESRQAETARTWWGEFHP